MATLSEVDEEAFRLECASEPHYPFKIHDGNDHQAFIMFGSVRTSSWDGWDGGGGRTDLHDMFGLMWAAALRASGVASASVYASEGWAGAPEIESRTIFFDQPYSSAMTETDFRKANAKITAHTARAAHLIYAAFGFEPPDHREPDWDEHSKPSWLGGLDRQIKDAPSGIWVTRSNPDWEYYINSTTQISIAKLAETAKAPLHELLGPYKPDIIEFHNGLAFSAGGLVNRVSAKIARKGVELVRTVEGKTFSTWDISSVANGTEPVVLLPLESHCLFFGNHTIVAIEAPCGLREFQQARESWKNISRKQAEVFNVGTEWEWEPKPDPARFEDLVRELLTEEQGLHWVRAAGPTFDRDQGRDLVAMWLTPPGMGQKLTAEQAANPVISRKVLVQVKTRKKTVGKTDITDVRDTLDRHEAEGILIVVSPGWSNDLYNYCERLAEKGVWVDLWARPELEIRLARAPHIAKRFTDIVWARS